MKNTKIIVLRTKEIIYTILFAALGILLIVLLFLMFWPKKDPDRAAFATESSSYIPGVYTSQFTINNNAMNLEVVLDEDQIKEVRLVNIDSDMATMYPLVEPALSSISLQLRNKVPISEIVLDDNSKYTQMLLLDAIGNALEKAKSAGEGETETAEADS